MRGRRSALAGSPLVLSAIVVAPQGARAADSGREYLGWSPTENWPRAISWQSEASAWLTLALRYLATGRTALPRAGS